MTEALVSINYDGQLMSANYYSITAETMMINLISDKLIIEVLRRANEPEGKNWFFTLKDIQVEILNKTDWKIEFFVSRDIPKWRSPF